MCSVLVPVILVPVILVPVILVPVILVPVIGAPASLRTYLSHTPSCVFMRPIATPLLKSILYFDYLL